MTAAILAALVATAISLKGPVDQSITSFEEKTPGEQLELQAAASGVIVAQIEHGAPVDLFISASRVEMDRVAKAGRLVAGSRRAIGTNRLVIVTRRGLDPPGSLEGLKDPRFARIAIGNPKTVPAGRYAEQTLHASALHKAVHHRLVFGESVRQVLDYVVRGEADAAIVYATEAALGGEDVKRGPDIEARLHDPILYEAGLIAGGKGAVRARAFLEFLASPDGLEILARSGFGPPPGAP